jgi:hypothetical protein
MGHPDFRANGKIFATLQADDQRGMVTLTAEEQREFMRMHPKMFVPASGAWGRQGFTMVQLAAADEATGCGRPLQVAQESAALRGMFGHIPVPDASSAHLQHNEDVQWAERGRIRHEENACHGDATV